MRSQSCPPPATPPPACIVTAKLYPYQRVAVTQMVALGGCGGLFAEMGTGKTFMALATARKLGCQRVVVVCPLFVTGVWEAEIDRVWPGAHTVDCTTGSVRTRAKRYVNGTQFSPVVFLVGWESFWREPLRKAIDQTYPPDMIIYDECHKLAGRATKQSLFAAKLARMGPGREPIRNRLGLSGTPAPNGPHDYYPVFRAIRPEVFGTRWYDFRGMYCRMGGYLGYNIVGYQNMAHLEALVHRHAYRITKAEALDLPPQVDVQVPVTLKPKLREFYDKLAKSFIAEIETAQGSGTVLSRIALTNTLRLQQVTSGYVKTTDDRILDVGSEKLEALAQLLEDALAQDGRVVVFARFRRDVERCTELSATYAKTFRIDGTIKKKGERFRLLQEFNETPRAVLVVQISVVALGVDLTSAHIGVFYSPDYSLSTYLQARDRLHRIKQEHKVTYYHLCAAPVDDGLYKTLATKEDAMRGVLDVNRLRRLWRG